MKGLSHSIVLSILFLCLNTPSIAQNNTVDPLIAHTDDTDVKPITLLADKSAPSAEMYRMNYWTVGAFNVVATAADIYAIPSIIKAKRDITDDEMKGLNRDVFSGLDRWALEQDPSKRDDYYKASDYVLPGVVVATALLGLDKNIQKEWFKIFMMYYEMHAITFSIYNFSPFGPAFQNKLRPVVYYDYFSYEDRKGGNNRNSMYSGHTASAAASTFFMVKVYSDYHPELGRKKYLLYALATVPPLVEGYLRTKALAHFPSDNLIGLAIGAAVGIGVPSLHKIRNRNINLGVVPTPVGPGLSLNWQPNYETRRLRALSLSTAKY